MNEYPGWEKGIIPEINHLQKVHGINEIRITPIFPPQFSFFASSTTQLAGMKQVASNNVDICLLSIAFGLR